jgi:hypothetical protein
MPNQNSLQEIDELSANRKAFRSAAKASQRRVEGFGPSPTWLAAVVMLGTLASAAAQTFFFSTGDADGRMATGSRPESPGKVEIESADDFNLTAPVTINNASFTGLLPANTQLSDVTEVVVEIYRVFPKDSAQPPSGNVPTRVNSPSDVAFLSRDSAAATLSFSTALLSQQFTAANSVLNGIHPKPNQATLGEGSVTGEEVRFDINFTTPIDLPIDHYFFIPQVQLASGDFLWLSAPKPIVAPGTPFNPDLQSWIRNGDLDPDWLRIGTDIIDGTTPQTFNGVFSLSGTVPDSVSTAAMLGVAMCLAVGLRAVRERQASFRLDRRIVVWRRRSD